MTSRAAGERARAFLGDKFARRFHDGKWDGIAVYELAAAFDAHAAAVRAEDERQLRYLVALMLDKLGSFTIPATAGFHVPEMEKWLLVEDRAVDGTVTMRLDKSRTLKENES